ncbi:MAG: metallophosphoesterase family protein [Beijerinckiaceae bacterium]
MVEPFRLAVLSDVHLAPLPAISFGALFGKRATGFLNWHLKRKHEHDMAVLEQVLGAIRQAAPDHILFGGDAVNLALSSEFARAGQFLARLGGPETVSAIPGNHDLYVEEARATLIATFGPWMTGDGESAPHFPYVRKRGPLTLIGLNSALPTPSFDASGKLGAHQIEATRHLLSIMPEDAIRIITLHHPPTVGGTAKGRDLTDAADFENMLRSTHADLIIHGHNHYQSLTWIEGQRGKIPVLGMMSGSGFNPHFNGIPGWAMVTVAPPDSGQASRIRVMAHEWGADKTLKPRIII